MQLIINRKFLAISAFIGIIVIFLGLIFGYKVIPDIIDKKIWEQKILIENTQQWSIFRTVPFPFKFKVYFFNIENPEDILLGAKPVVKEVGPYVYKVSRWKNEIEWNTTNYISYNDYMLFKFDQKATGNLSDDDYITVLNTPLYGMILIGEKLSESILPTIEQSLPLVFGENSDLFIKIKVKDFLFDGMPMCKDGGGENGFTAKMICGQVMKQAIKQKPMRIENNTAIFAYLHFKNNTHLGKWTILSGQSDPLDAGRLVKYDGQEYLKVWKGKQSICNKVRGSTGVFPNHITEDMEFDVFGEDVCRSMTLVYNNTETFKDIEGFKFIAARNSLSSPKDFVDNECFCVNKTRDLDGSFRCLGNGLLDLTACTGAPALMSFPHVLYGDKKYLDSVEGLHPDEEKHATFVTFEPISGTPIKLAKRVQFNIFLRPINGVEMLQNVSNSLMPMFWLEESMELPDRFTDMLKNKLLKTLKIFETARWVFLVFGVATIVLPFFLYVYTQQ